MNPNRASFRYEFHLCFAEPDGNRVIGFDVYFSFRHPQIFYSLQEKEGGGRRESFPLLTARARFVDEDWELVPFFRLQHHPCGKVSFIRRRSRLRVRIVSEGSGGNWYWHVYRLPSARWAHMMNQLRRWRRHYSFEEWDDEFRELWDHPRSLRLPHLKSFASRAIRYAVQQRREQLEVFA